MVINILHGNFFVKDAETRQVELEYTPFNWNTQGTKHFARVKECSKYRNLRKNQKNL